MENTTKSPWQIDQEILATCPRPEYEMLACRRSSDRLRALILRRELQHGLCTILYHNGEEITILFNQTRENRALAQDKLEELAAILVNNR